MSALPDSLSTRYLYSCLAIDSLVEKNTATVLSLVAKWVFFIGNDPAMNGRGEDFQRVQTQMRTAARDAWYATLLRLRTLSETLGKRADYRNIIDCWGALGDSLGLKEETERARYSQQGTRLCSWAACRHYFSSAPNALSTCKGCQEARYCSRDCQRRYVIMNHSTMILDVHSLLQ